jgi:predicted permease
MDTFLQDVRFALRQISRQRATTAVVVLTLALGMAANTSMFTLLNATLFRSPPAESPDRLAWVTVSFGQSKSPSNMSYPDYVDVRDRAKSFSGLLGYTHAMLSFGGARPERVRGELVTGNYFPLLGIRAQLGRTFRADEDRSPNGNPVAVLSDDFWHRRFGADPSVVDRTIVLNGRPFTVIGVAPPGFSGVEMNDDEPHAIWIPMSMLATAEPTWAGLLTDRNASGFLRVIGRLAPGASRANANSELTVIARQLRPATVKADDRMSLAASAVQGGVDPSNRAELLPVLSLLMLVPVLVLVVACANAANVLVARGLSRRKEIAVRRALGASRARLARQLLTESVTLSLMAGAAGILLSFWMTSLIARVGDVPAGVVEALTPDRAVMFATVILAGAAGVLFGLAPALTATQTALSPSLRNEGITLSFGRQRHRLRDTFVVGQVAVSLVLLVTAGLFARSLSKALHVDPGYTARNGMYLSFDLGKQNYPAERQESFKRDVLAKVRAIAGVQSAALASTVPFGGSYDGGSARAEGMAEDARGADYLRSSVTPGYFDALGVAFVRGRGFSGADNASSASVVVINETLARRLWPQGDAIGKRLNIGGRTEPLREVVGVVHDGRYANLTESRRGYVYLPERQRPSSELVLVTRTAGPPERLMNSLRVAVQSLDPNLPLFNVTTFAERLHGAADKQQAASSMLGVFGFLALVLAALGMFSVTAHGVAMRTREIGIRMALGARSVDVSRLFVREGMGRTVVGVTIGLVVSVGLSRLLASFLFGLTATDMLTFATGAGVLCLVAVVASYIPSRRAARVDPVVALRAE